uniref:Uncharacterized protein n=1 Tax=Solanum lycopersicum TaxID=4081 RepID=A0A3Q7IFF4_SOLLC
MTGSNVPPARASAALARREPLALSHLGSRRVAASSLSGLLMLFNARNDISFGEGNLGRDIRERVLA